MFDFDMKLTQTLFFDFFCAFLNCRQKHMLGGTWLDTLLDDDDEFIAYKKIGVGTGHSKSGSRESWTKKYFFEQDLMEKYERELKEREFKSTFAGYSARELRWFFETIKDELVRPKETEWHARNKLLLWLDKLHNSLSGQQMRNKYKIGQKTAYSHVEDVLQSIIASYENSDVVRFPNKKEREEMKSILKRKGAELPEVLFALDGSHARCTGRNIKERLSFKYRWLPCFNVLFVTERVLNTVCAFSIDPQAKKHDITVLREAWFYKHLDDIMDGDIILADKGYVGCQSEVESIAAVLKLNMPGRKHFTKQYWRSFNVARSECERVFGDFFHNKFSQLGHWPGKSKQTFMDFSTNITCCIILYNSIKHKSHLI